MSHVFTTRDLAAVGLGAGDLPRLQALYHRCVDFVQLVFRRNVRSDEAAELLAALPAGKDVADKFVYGLETAAGDLAGVVELVRDFPGDGEWFLGLLLLAPEIRGSGAGTRVMDAVEARLRAEGATAVYLAVQEQNPRARRFWERRGFIMVHEAHDGVSRVFRLRKELE